MSEFTNAMTSAKPLDGDDIRQRIFAAGASLGGVDPFLASELTDGVMHFLRRDGNLAALAQGQTGFIATLVRELGHPRIAQEMDRQWENSSRLLTPVFSAAPSTIEIANRWLLPQLREYSRTQVYPANLIAADDIGFLSIEDLDCPFELYGGVIDPIAYGPNPELALVEAALAARRKFGKFLVFRASGANLDPIAWTRALCVGLRLSGRTVLVHLSRELVHSATRSPSLFTLPGEHDDEMSPWLRALTSDEAVAANIVPVVHIAVAAVEARLGSILQNAGSVATRLIVALDRPNRPAWLAEGLDERRIAILGRLQVRLPQLFAQLDPKPTADVFLKKLGSLARLALAAGHAKKDHLRKYGGPEVSGGFLLERAGLAVDVQGIDALASVLFPDGSSDIRDNYATCVRAKLQSAFVDGSTKAIPTSLVETRSPVPIEEVPQTVFKRGAATDKLTVNVRSCPSNCVELIRTALLTLVRQNCVSALDLRFQQPGSSDPCTGVVSQLG